MADPKPKRRWYQFSLRTLLIVVLVAGAGLGLLGRKLQKQWQAEKERREAAERNERTVEDLKLAGFDADWGSDLFHPIFFVSGTSRVTDNDLECLKGLNIRRLYLATLPITDAGLEHLKGLTKLEFLDLEGTQVTDAGLVHLKEVAELEYLGLVDTLVTEVGVEELERASPQLSIHVSPDQLAAAAELLKSYPGEEQAIAAIRWLGGQFDWMSTKYPPGTSLYVPGDRLTDAHLVHLEGLIGLRCVRIDSTYVTDAGLVHLKGLTKLESLDLEGTQVADAGLAYVGGLSKVRYLYLSDTQVNDRGLERLAVMGNLRWLTVRRTQVTEEGVQKLQQALPNCHVDY
jgi:hypothetical protein